MSQRPRNKSLYKLVLSVLARNISRQTAGDISSDI